MIHDKNSSREAPGLPADCREDVPASCEGRLGVQRQNNNVSSGLCSAEPIGNQVPKPVSSGRVVLHPALALFGPASVTLRTSVVSVRNIPSPCKVHLRNTEAGRMHSLNVAGIMILLAIIALFVLAWLVV